MNDETNGAAPSKGDVHNEPGILPNKYEHQNGAEIKKEQQAHPNPKAAASVGVGTARHEAWEAYGSLIIKSIALVTTILGGVFGYLLIDRVTLSQKQAELEHKQVQLAISISKEKDPKAQADMLEILKVAYTSESSSHHIKSLTSRMESNINIALQQKESINALKAKVATLNKEIAKKSVENAEKINAEKRVTELEKEISLLSVRSPVTSNLDLKNKENVDVAIIVGRNESSPGGSNQESGITEHAIALELSEKLMSELSKRGISSTIVHRKNYRELPAQVNNTGSKLTVSLRTNYFNTRASGSEVLYPSDNTKSKELAVTMLSAITKSLSLIDRGPKPKGRDDRGGYLLTNVRSPIVILLPFFIDNNNDLLVYQENKTKLVNNLAIAIKDYLEE